MVNINAHSEMLFIRVHMASLEIFATLLVVKHEGVEKALDVVGGPADEEGNHNRP